MPTIQPMLALLRPGAADPRTARAHRNILWSFLFRGLSAGIGFALVPVTLGYLGPVSYGLWLTLLTVIDWFALCDVGLGQGLRNSFAEALARRDRERAGAYVSTAYAVLGAIALGLFVLFLAAHRHIPWAVVFNAPPGPAADLSQAVAVLFGFFLLQLVLKLLFSILAGDQRTAAGDGIAALVQAGTLGSVLFLAAGAPASLALLSAATGGVQALVLVGASAVLFAGRYAAFRPSLSRVRGEYARPLTTLGARFFLIQITWIVIFSTDSMIVTHLFGPASVTPYMVAYKYFGAVTLMAGILFSPWWSAYTEAWHQGDSTWIRTAVRRQLVAWSVLAGAAILMATAAPWIYRRWVGDGVRVPEMLSWLMALAVILAAWNNVFVYCINGIGKIRLQQRVSLLGAVLNIPLSILFGKLLGLPGVILATCVSLGLGAVFAPLQYRRIMDGSARGIWNG